MASCRMLRHPPDGSHIAECTRSFTIWQLLRPCLGANQLSRKYPASLYAPCSNANSRHQANGADLAFRTRVWSSRVAQANPYVVAYRTHGSVRAFGCNLREACLRPCAFVCAQRFATSPRARGGLVGLISATTISSCHRCVCPTRQGHMQLWV